MSNLDALKGKVQQVLSQNLNNVQLSKNGGWSARNGSTRVFIDCRDWGEDNTIVKITVPVLFDVRRSPELYEYVAFHSGQFVFGTLTLEADEDPAKARIFLEHSLLGDYLDEPELLEAVLALAYTADDLDDELKAKFGGVRFHEDD